MIIFDFIKKHLSFCVQPITWLSILIAVLIYPCVKYLPPHFGYENGVIENLQMVFLLIAFLLCLKAKTNKKLFRFSALVILIIALREVNCGRTLFFPVPGVENAFYSWKDIKYGYLAHPIYGLYIAYVAFYFLKNKLFIPLFEIIKKVALPFWNILFLISGILLAEYAEKCTENFVFEEMSELLIYASLIGIIYLFAYKKDFQIINSCSEVSEEESNIG